MKRKKQTENPQYQTHFHVSDGNDLKEIDPSSRDWYGDNSLFYYIIAREEVEACDTRRLLHDLRLEQGNPFLKLSPGSVIFSVNGYDEDPRDLLQIPEFRAYVRKVQEEAPCWLYFSMPSDGWLRIILAASSPDCQYIERNGEFHVVINKGQVAEFMESQLKGYYRLRERMGIKGGGIDNHLHETLKDSFPELLTL